MEEHCWYLFSSNESVVHQACAQSSSVPRAVLGISYHHLFNLACLPCYLFEIVRQRDPPFFVNLHVGLCLRRVNIHEVHVSLCLISSSCAHFWDVCKQRPPSLRATAFAANEPRHRSWASQLEISSNEPASHDVTSALVHILCDRPTSSWSEHSHQLLRQSESQHRLHLGPLS